MHRLVQSSVCRWRKTPFDRVRPRQTQFLVFLWSVTYAISVDNNKKKITFAVFHYFIIGNVLYSDASGHEYDAWPSVVLPSF